jgi:hypothetical protein
MGAGMATGYETATGYCICGGGAAYGYAGGYELPATGQKTARGGNAVACIATLGYLPSGGAREGARVRVRHDARA